MIELGSTLAGEFTLRNPTTGAASNADSLPTGTLVRNGDNTAITVTITNKATGRYKFSAPISAAYSRGDRIQIVVAATVATIADNFPVVDDTCDLPVEDFIEELIEELPEGTIQVAAPIVDSDVTLYANSDYMVDTDRLFITNDGTATWPDLSGGEFETIEFHATINGTTAKYGTGTVITPTGANKEVAIAFTREELNTMAALVPADTVNIGGFSLQQRVASGTYAVFAFDGDCNQFTLSTGALTIVPTPFDDTGSACPL